MTGARTGIEKGEDRNRARKGEKTGGDNVEEGVGRIGK